MFIIYVDKTVLFWRNNIDELGGLSIFWASQVLANLKLIRKLYVKLCSVNVIIFKQIVKGKY